MKGREERYIYERERGEMYLWKRESRDIYKKGRDPSF